jgi:soluble lytic murein transglycosylase
MDHAGKVRLLTGGRDVAICSGLEIGPRDAPLIRKADGPVLYADYADTATVRANLHGSGVDPAGVLDVDVVTGGGSLAAVMPHRVDYVVASHVAEHVPDLLGWLIDIHAVLNEGGTLGLAIPDRRFTFDRFRRESTIAEAVEAHLLGLTRPSLRQVFDSAWPAVAVGVEEAWRNAVPADSEARLARLKPALELVRRLQADPVYNDAHCWVFTPATFLDMLEQAARMELLPYSLLAFHPTELGGYEFYAVLRRAEGDHVATTRESLAAARVLLSGWPAEAAYAEAHAPELAAMRAENAALRAALAAMRGSRLWRATEPLRRVGRALKKKKSFGSFLQKRTACFLCLLLWAGVAQAESPILDAMHAHDWPRAESLAAREPDPIAQKLVTFARLLTPGAASAAEIGAFLAAHPTWPDAVNLHHRLADAIVADADQATALADCETYKPGLDTALLRCAAAELAAGHDAAARNLAQRAWIDGVRDPAAEQAFLAAWPKVLTPDVQWRRFDVLDWANDPAAGRQVARLDGGHRAEAAARLAFAHRDPRALDFLPSVPENLRSDPALLLEQARWLRLTDADSAALALWRGAASAAEARIEAEHRVAFWGERDRLARAVLAQGDVAGAYYLADDANAAGDQLPDALFLAGWIALERQHDAARALQKFDALQAVSHSVITQARAWYWVGRATTGDAASDAYRRAAAFPTAYYGQLAIAQWKGADAVAQAILQASDPVIPAGQAKVLAGTEMVRAATLLVGWGDPHWARQFLLQQSKAATTPAAFAFAARRAAALGLRDVSVQTARFAGRQGVALPQVGWPAPFDPPAGPPPGVDPALVLGLMRQESSFDPGIVSYAGAVGLMQLMPATARQVAGRGAFDLKSPDANMRLGVAYFEKLLAAFGGARACAIAAYNAGPHRARLWVEANGDPGPASGTPAAIDWIEQIPFAETRNYVQRVLENTAIYAARGVH